MSRRAAAAYDSGVKLLAINEPVFERVPRSALIVVLSNYRKQVIRRFEINLPIPLFVTMLTARVTGTFSEQVLGLAGQSWKDIFTLGSVGCGFWLVFALFRYLWADDSPEKAVDQIQCSEITDDESASSPTLGGGDAEAETGQQNAQSIDV